MVLWHIHPSIVMIRRSTDRERKKHHARGRCALNLVLLALSPSLINDEEQDHVQIRFFRNELCEPMLSSLDQIREKTWKANNERSAQRADWFEYITIDQWAKQIEFLTLTQGNSLTNKHRNNSLVSYLFFTRFIGETLWSCWPLAVFKALCFQSLGMCVFVGVFR